MEQRGAGPGRPCLKSGQPAGSGPTPRCWATLVPSSPGDRSPGVAVTIATRDVAARSLTCPSFILHVAQCLPEGPFQDTGGGGLGRLFEFVWANKNLPDSAWTLDKGYLLRMSCPVLMLPFAVGVTRGLPRWGGGESRLPAPGCFSRSCSVQAPRPPSVNIPTPAAYAAWGPALVTSPIPGTSSGAHGGSSQT